MPADWPQVACPALMHRGPVLTRPDAAARALAALLETDPPLARQLMAVARTQGPCSSLHDAALRLGVQRTRQLIDALCWRAPLAPIQPTALVGAPAGPGADPLPIWRHGLACAHAAFALAQFTGRVSPDDAWRMGLLHDIGLRRILERAPVTSASQDAAPSIAGNRLRGRLALRTLRSWDLPDEQVLAIAFHDHPGRGANSDALALLRLAHRIADDLDHGFGPRLDTVVDIASSGRRLALAETALDRIRMAVQPRIESMLAELAAA